jgi:hypothetical protein
MNLQAYIAHLEKIVEDRPDMLLALVVTADDDEGNGFTRVSYAPAVGHYDEDERVFTNEESNVGIPNAICLN